jgi:hypothetical protein
VSHSLRHEYLERLEELLPPKEAPRVREDVAALIEDRIEAELERHPDLDATAAERAALEALGPPEQLADELVSSPLTISLATRRTFVRVLAAVFACHLLLSVALTFAGARWDSIPGILAPLPLEPFAAVFLGVVTIFLIDTGALLLLFVAIGRAAPERLRPLVPLPGPVTRRGALEGLVLLALLALIVNLFLDAVFSVRQGDTMRPFLAPDLKALVPYANGVLGFFALRHVAVLVSSRHSLFALTMDALGCLTGSALLVVAATQGKLVSMPSSSKLGREAAQVLDNLIERVFLVVLIIAALLLVIRFVRQAIRMGRLLRR